LILFFFLENDFSEKTTKILKDIFSIKEKLRMRKLKITLEQSFMEEEILIFSIER